MADLLSPEAVAEKLEALPGWGLDDGTATARSVLRISAGRSPS